MMIDTAPIIGKFCYIWYSKKRLDRWVPFGYRPLLKYIFVVLVLVLGGSISTCYWYRSQSSSC